MKLAILSIIGLFVLLASTETYDHDQINCLIKHLKRAKQLQANYPELNVAKFKICEVDFIKTVQEELYKETALTFRQQPDLGPLTDCIMKNLRTHYFAEDMMKEIVHASSETLSDAEKKEKKEHFDSAKNKTVGQAIDSCDIMQGLTGHYDSLSALKNASEIEHEKAIEEYCARKHVVDKNLTAYAIDVNPNNLTVSTVNCDEINRTAFRKLIGEIVAMVQHKDALEFNSDQTRCALGKLREVNFIDRLVTADMISHLNITEEQKKTERDSFIAYSDIELNKLKNCTLVASEKV